MGVNVTLLKQASFLSVIIGFGVGLISLIPVVGCLVFVLYFLLFSAGLIIYLKRNNILGEISVKEGAIFGAVTGTISFAGLYCSCLPIILIISLINQNYNPLISAFLKTGFTNPLALFGLLFLLLLGALLCGLMNCFGGGVIAYVYEVLKTLNEDNSNNNKFQL